ncbi:hypothetical protein FBD94_05015 [Pedobacter hiemivivus]|uniref:Uncharacterized protein n=1 Tax=Pedobacter hiemivivus TaxID=2530454 RepID=A0A4U1GL41_9SPHI|nr:hypothetical protein [Pedobacter hiemivivus]TKC63710.1 hypothetical protein FBD94_05015 [Pedobacter hiemivivus]
MQRLCIYPKEAASLLKVGERQAQRIFKSIRKEINKKKRQFITVKEFSEYKGVDELDVLNALNKLYN